MMRGPSCGKRGSHVYNSLTLENRKKKMDSSEMGKRGAKARNKNMTPKERSEAARNAANARHKKLKKVKAAK